MIERKDKEGREIPRHLFQHSTVHSILREVTILEQDE